jgi:hypothetical protein
VKSLRWVAEHTAALPAESGVNFEHVVVAVEAVGLLDVENHLNPTKYPTPGDRGGLGRLRVPGSLNLGTSSNTKVEQQVLEQVGSYGKQIGHLAEALELVIQMLHLMEHKDLSQHGKDAVQVFLGDVAAVRKFS